MPQLYKLRAECNDDFNCLVQRLVSTPGFSLMGAVAEGPFPDVEATFKSKLDLEALRDIIRQIPDGHVMLQTLAPADQYTGERDYDLM